MNISYHKGRNDVHDLLVKVWVGLEKQNIADNYSDQSDQDLGQTHEEVSHQVQLWDDVFSSFSQGKHFIGGRTVVQALKDCHGVRVF
jgi:hypothetical protein